MMPFKARLVLSGAMLVVLLAALGAVAWHAQSLPAAKFDGSLGDLFPAGAAVSGWTVSRRPVAETEEMKRAVADVLNYDDAIYSVYESADKVRISFYAAYWRPGKMSHRLVATHTPDVCWVGGGWVRMKAESLELKVESRAKPVAESLELRVESGVRLKDESLELRAGNVEGGTRSLSMEYREFRLGGQTEYVVFGHIVGGRSMSYGTGGLPPWYGFLSDLWARGFRQRDEQLFVRISSNRPWEEFKDAPPVQHFLRRLSAQMGIRGRRDGRRTDGRRRTTDTGGRTPGVVTLLRGMESPMSGIWRLTSGCGGRRTDGGCRSLIDG